MAESLTDYEITESDAAKFNNTVSVGDKYPFLPVIRSEDGTVSGHLFLPHIVAVHSYVEENQPEIQEGES